jgi:hypothetical protein
MYRHYTGFNNELRQQQRMVVEGHEAQAGQPSTEPQLRQVGV